MFRWLKDRLIKKTKNFSLKRIKSFLKKNGLAFVVIFVGWEIMEDVIFPIIFGFLGNYVHPAFYAGIPASLILCFHWLAMPILWGLWLRFSGTKDEIKMPEDACCDVAGGEE